MKLKTSQIKSVRQQMLAEQDHKCQICKLPIPESKDRLDHDHSTGLIRSVLCDGCNRLLGKVEANYKRFQVNLDAFLAGVHDYVKLHRTDQTGLTHPTHLTPEERKAKAKARQARARKAKKVTK